MDYRQRQIAVKALTCSLLFQVVLWMGCSSTNPSLERDQLKPSAVSGWNYQATAAQVGPEYLKDKMFFLPVKCAMTGDHLLIILYSERSGGFLSKSKIKGALNGERLKLVGMLMASADRMADMRKSGMMEIVSCNAPEFSGLIGSPNRAAYAILFESYQRLRPGQTVVISGVADCPEMTVSIAAPDASFGVGKTQLMTDPAMLAKVALEDKAADVRMAAVNNRSLTDKTVLAKVALEDKDGDVRRAAVNHRDLTDQAVLAKVALEDKDCGVRWRAVGKLTDQAVLAKVALEDKDGIVRRAAVNNRSLADQTVLAKVALEDRDGDIRKAAVNNRSLTDQAVLAKVALEDKYTSAREAAIARLSDAAILARLMAEDNYDPIRNAARNRLKSINP